MRSGDAWRDSKVNERNKSAMTTPSETMKEKLIEALLSDQVTPSASKHIARMINELTKREATGERIDAMVSELVDIMANLSGPIGIV
jgi:hypothetical protein